MINVHGIRRNLKNVVNNYSEAQVKVREATSNDPWGPSSTLMSEIADLTYNVVAFSEIMSMIWKRLNDNGKNWRHVYKALVLLDYLIKTGSEKVGQQCKENIFAIQTLKDFQYIEENKDQGMNVREKSKMLVSLLKDDEKLKNERSRALKAKERFAQSVSYMSSSTVGGGDVEDGESETTMTKTSLSYHESLSSPGASGGGSVNGRALPVDLENARPQTLGEEELQLQLALAMSKEEAEQEERIRRSDDLRLKMALTESQRAKLAERKAEAEAKKSAMDDLLSLNVGGPPKDPWGVAMNSGSSVNNAFMKKSPSLPISQTDPFLPKPPNLSEPLGVDDPWVGAVGGQTDNPWQASPVTSPQTVDPWSPNCDNSTSSPIDIENWPQNGNQSPAGSYGSNQPRKTPESFLGCNSNLVNLDALVTTKNSPAVPVSSNPFAQTTASNPFQAAKPPPPTINQLRAQNNFTSFDASAYSETSQTQNNFAAGTTFPSSNSFHQTSATTTTTTTTASKNPFAM